MKISKTRATLKSNKSLRSRKSLGATKPKQRKKRVPLEKKPINQLISEADKWFSRYVRLRDCDMDARGWYGTCITCTKTGLVVYIDATGRMRFMKGWDNGHFVTRGNFITRFEEENNNLQCAFRCNRMRSGEYVKYKSALRLKYGENVPEKLERLADEQPGNSYKFSRAELLGIIEDCKQQVAYYERNWNG